VRIVFSGKTPARAADLQKALDPRYVLAQDEPGGISA
jgi:hypothetical protein